MLNHQKHGLFPLKTEEGNEFIKTIKFFLNDGEEFEIEIYNPTKNNILSSIKLDSKLISDTGLIVRSGERIYLNCFIGSDNDNKKFTFSTYEVEDTNESKEAISSNGVLEVSFYKEDFIGEIDLTKRSPFNTYPYPTYLPYPYPLTYCSGNYTLTTNGNSNTISSTNNSTFDTTTTNYNGLGTMTTSIETGQTSKGSKSDQKFNEINMDFEDKVLSSIIYKLLPESRKPKTKKDLNKVSKNISNSHNYEEIYLNIIKFKNLNKEGVLSDEEFNIIKEGVIDKMKKLLESMVVNDIEELYLYLNDIGKLKKDGILEDKDLTEMKEFLIGSLV